MVILSAASLEPPDSKISLGRGATKFLSCSDVPFKSFCSDEWARNSCVSRSCIMFVKQRNPCNYSIYRGSPMNVSHVMTAQLRCWLFPQLYWQPQIVRQLFIAISTNYQINWVYTLVFHLHVLVHPSGVVGCYHRVDSTRNCWRRYRLWHAVALCVFLRRN